MTKAIFVTAGNHAGRLADRGHDVYATPAIAVRKLIKAEWGPRFTLNPDGGATMECKRPPSPVWDPCGPDDSELAATLRFFGHTVITNDIAVDGVDFLTRKAAPEGAEAICTNPPFKDAAAIVDHGLTLVPNVIILERLQFLESERRDALFERGHLERVWVFRKRLPRMHRANWTGPKASASMALAWFVFSRDYRGAPAIGWI